MLPTCQVARPCPRHMLAVRNRPMPCAIGPRAIRLPRPLRPVASVASGTTGSGGDEQLDPDHEAVFMRLVAGTADVDTKDMLRLNKAKLVKNEVITATALQALTPEKLMAYGLSEAAAGALKLAFPSPVTTGAAAGSATATGAGGQDPWHMTEQQKQALEAFAKDVRAASSQLFPGGVVPLGSDTSIPDLSALRNTCLRLANDWPISVVPRVLARPLLIREPYLELLKSLCRLPADFAVIVTGTPGIGKSTFALFFICWLAAQRQKVLFTYQSQDTKETDILLDFTRPDSVKVDKASEGKGDLWRLMAAREEGTVWRLIDGKAPPNTQYKGGGRTIVLSSPSIRNWKEFIKTGLDYVWYLPVWSLEELLTCHKLVCPNLQVDVRQRYNDFGGSARFVIGEKAHIPFELVAESLSPEQAKAVYYLSMEGTESDLRHVFAHIAVGKDHKFAGYFLGSYKMRAVVFDKAASVFWRDLVTLLRTSGRDPRLGVVAGGLLEEYGHRVLQQGLQLAEDELPRLLSRRGKGRPPSQLTDAQKKPQQLTDAQKKPQQLTDAQKSLQAKIIQALAQPKARVIDNSGVDLGKISGSYVVPAIITNAGWDALICDGDAVYAVLTTCNSQHGLLAAAYVELRRRVPAGMDVHVLLMVPSERFERYPWQSWRDGTTVLKPKDVPAELNSMQQWAVLLEPSSDPDTMPPGDPEAATTSQLGDGDVEGDTSSNEMEG